MIPYNYTKDKEIFFVHQSKPFTFKRDNENFYEIVRCVEQNDIEGLKNVIEAPAVIAELGFFTCTENGHVYYKKKQLSKQTATLIYDRIRGESEREAWYQMLDKIAQNPRRDIMHEILLWIEEAKLAIFEDGDILAFKKVRRNYMSIHDGTTMNIVGSVVSLPREQCDENRNSTCSSGLHFCSYGYLSKFSSFDSSSDRVLILKINPKDIVAIPKDYNNKKGRSCSYLIWGEEGVEAETPQDYDVEKRSTVSKSETKHDSDNVTDAKLIKLYNEHGSYTKAAFAAGMNRKKFTRLYKRAVGEA